MSQDTEREDFEARWPTPSGVAWIDAADGYGAVSDRALGLMAQQARWEGWQARAALASQQAVKGEPYAHIVELPAGEYAGTVKFFTAPSDPRGRPVYLNQPSPPSREPLTDDAILDAFCHTPGIHQFVQAFKAGARFAERAHGIHSRGEGEKA